MSEWKKVKIGSFLKVRQGKYKPDDDAIANLKRLGLMRQISDKIPAY